MTDSPAWAVELLVELTSPDDDRRFAAVSKAWGFPFTFSDIPRPGLCRGWESQDWQKWAGAHGFGDKTKTAHAYQHTYNATPRLAILFTSCSTTPGDRRGMLRSASEFRARARTWFSAHLAITLLTLKGHFTTIEALRSELYRLTTTPEALTKVKEELQAVQPDTASKLPQFVSDLEKLAKDFNLTNRHAFSILGLPDTSIDSLLLRMRQPREQWNIPETFIDEVHQLLLDRQEEDAEDAVEPRSTPIAAVAREATLNEQFEASVSALHSALNQPLGDSTPFRELVAKLKDVGDRMVSLVTAVGENNKTAEVLPKEVPQILQSLKDRVIAIQAGLYEERVAHAAELQHALDDLADANDLLDHADETNPWKDKLIAVYLLIQNKLANGDMFVLVPAIQALKEEAAKQLKELQNAT